MMSQRSQLSVVAQAKRAKEAAFVMRNASTEKKRLFLENLSQLLLNESEAILEANTLDRELAEKQGLSSSFLERLGLTTARIESLSAGVQAVSKQIDPIGEVLFHHVREDGLKIEKVSVPLGVIGLIYESRPGVTIDSAALCIYAGNAVLLRSGKDARRSTETLSDIIQRSLHLAGLPADAAQMISDQSYEAVQELVRLEGLVDLVIPRGGESLIRQVVEHARVPVLKHYKGVCHLYADRLADAEKAEKILLNAKCQRPGVCNSLETLLVHQETAADLLPRLGQALVASGVEVRACPVAQTFLPQAVSATEEDWSTEYLDLIISVRVVKDIEEALTHIERYGSRHTDAIVTEDESAAKLFLENVDSAVVLHNASTRLCDGAEFGLGAEIGISTDKLHARGPMGVRELTSYQWRLRGEGHTR